MSVSVICPECGRPNRLPGTRVSREPRACGHCAQPFHPEPELRCRFRPGAPVRWGRVLGLVVLASAFLAGTALSFKYIPTVRAWVAELRR